MAIGIDVGGTFTDIVRVSDGVATVAKVATTIDQSDGVVAGALRVHAHDEPVLVHGTTAATNALLEHRGARVAMITDDGFRDFLEIGRSDRPALYDITVSRPEPLVPRELRFEAGDDGMIDRVVAADPDVVVVVLRNSYLDGAGEQAIRARLVSVAPSLDVVLSHEIANEFREFERASTAVTAGYLRPVVRGYLERLETAAVPEIARDILIMRSNGGVAPIEEGAANPASILLSGPAGGVAAASDLAIRLGIDRCVSFDMGGTSTDVARIEGGLPVIARHTEVGGYPTLMPTVAIHTVGAGGGSIAWTDAGGALRVGPASAGAVPGPAGYGRGGTQPTVTDANIVVGRIDPDAVFGDGVAIDVLAARSSVATLASELGMDLETAATGIIDVVESHMERAISEVSVRDGYDIRSASLIAFGGAGGLHAVAVAGLLDMESVVIPNHAGVFSAVGLLLSPLRMDVTFPSLDLTTVSLVDLRSRAGDVAVRRFTERTGRKPETVEFTAMMRYAGQSYELAVPVGSAASSSDAEAAFHVIHEQRNGFSRLDDGIELVAVMASALADLAIEVPAPRPRSHEVGARSVRTAHGTAHVDVLQRGALKPGSVTVGPTVIEDSGSTIWVPDGHRVSVLAGGEIEIRR